MSKILLSILLFTLLVSARPRKDIVLADFEGASFNGWKTTGVAFGTSPVRPADGGTKVSGIIGNGYASSRNGVGEGTLTSPEFLVNRHYLNFFLGGGAEAANTSFNLLIEGKVVMTRNGGPKKQLNGYFFDLDQYKGKMASIQITDHSKDNIFADQLYLSDRIDSLVRVDNTLNLSVDNRYLLLPVNNNSPKSIVRVEVDGVFLDEFGIKLGSNDDMDFHAFIDLEKYKGKKISVIARDVLYNWNMQKSIVLAPTLPQWDSLYHESLRPRFHFTSRVGWNNDPNGMVYMDGEYHLYYQHNPFGWEWGNMHWGHAVSKDMLHWEDLGDVIRPVRYSDWVFSGSAHVDKNNTSGWQKGSNKTIVATYTSTGRGEVIAYSNDKGRTFTEYEGSPIIKHKGRDPKLVWYEPGKHWVIVAFSEQKNKAGADERGIAFYSSKDLKSWKEESFLSPFFECPELFQLDVPNKPGEKKWVVYGADGNYLVGDFNGKVFTPDFKEKKIFSHGKIFYASQTFSNPPDGRVVQIAWGRLANSPGMPFNQCMLFPVKLRLEKDNQGYRMLPYPIQEAELLQGTGIILKGKSLGEVNDMLKKQTGMEWRIKIKVDNLTSPFTLSIGTNQMTVKPDQITCGGKTAILSGNSGVELDILVDRTTIEIFGNKGEAYMPFAHNALINSGLNITGDEAMKIESVALYPMNSIWK